MKKTNLGGARTHDLWFERQRLTPTPVRPVDTYTLYYRREETKNNRSEWCSGRALAFKTIGRGFAPRQPVFFSNVGDAFASWPRRMIYLDAPPLCRSLLLDIWLVNWNASPTFSHVDPFHFIIQIHLTHCNFEWQRLIPYTTTTCWSFSVIYHL